MKVIVITGSTRGIGLGLAKAFLERGCAVAVSGRTQASVDKTVVELGTPERVVGHPCDVADVAQVQALWDATTARFGRVDVWINNAGVGQRPVNFVDLTAEEVRVILDSNLLGCLYGSQVALRGMLVQGSGQLYNMEGYGSDGSIRAAMGVYGTTKRGLRYFTQSLVVETKGTPVQIGTLGPGIVVTEGRLGSDTARAELSESTKRMLNIMADRVETVTPWLADQVLANKKTNAHIEWLTHAKILARLISAPFSKRAVVTP